MNRCGSSETSHAACQHFGRREGQDEPLHPLSVLERARRRGGCDRGSLPGAHGGEVPGRAVGLKRRLPKLLNHLLDL